MVRLANESDEEPFAILYDLRESGAWKRCCRHRSLWGKLYTDPHALDDHHVLLVFPPALNRRWAAWEEVRRRWILGELRKAA